MSIRLPRGEELYRYSPYLRTLTHVPVAEAVFFEKGVPLDSLRLIYEASLSTFWVPFLADNSLDTTPFVAESSSRDDSFLWTRTFLKLSWVTLLFSTASRRLWLAALYPFEVERLILSSKECMWLPTKLKALGFWQPVVMITLPLGNEPVLCSRAEPPKELTFEAFGSILAWEIICARLKGFPQKFPLELY